MKYSSKLDILRSICITNIINCIIMLGINAPKVLAKGKYAQAVRKAALASIGANAKKTMPQRHLITHINLSGIFDNHLRNFHIWFRYVLKGQKH